MKFHEYLTYGIIVCLVLNLFISLFLHDWNAVGLCITAIAGWFHVQGYERQERREREVKFMDDRFTV